MDRNEVGISCLDCKITARSKITRIVLLTLATYLRAWWLIWLSVNASYLLVNFFGCLSAMSEKNKEVSCEGL